MTLGLILIYIQAVHSGADLESAITNCMGYRSEVSSQTSAEVPQQNALFLEFDRTSNALQGEGFMVGVQINPVPNLPSGFPVIS